MENVVDLELAERLKLSSDNFNDIRHEAINLASCYTIPESKHHALIVKAVFYVINLANDCKYDKTLEDEFLKKLNNYINAGIW